jgi:two-component sensor histidine kinase
VEISAQMLASGGVEAVVRDVSQRKAQEAQRNLMMHELNHRVKNSLAAVQAIAVQTLRGDAARPEARQAFVERLMALARANDILVAKEWRGASLADIAAQVASPYAGPDGRFVIRGPELTLRPQAATAMALALHELATNAAKYGALSAVEGRVVLEWRLDPQGAEPEFELTWREEGGPPVAMPSRTGFGTRLLQDGLKAELSAQVRMDYLPDGFACTIRARLPAPSGGFLDLHAPADV